jgi:serine protease Do
VVLGGPGGPLGDLFGDDLLRRFFGDRMAPEQGQSVKGVGSGVIVSKDGYILTNNHVVDGADQLYILIGDERKPAKVVGTDPATDLAVIKVDAADLPAANLGSSAEARVGEWVLAVGNPYQLLHTVTAGIISAKGRGTVGLAEYEDFLQTDASINPGNSGGALADLDGRVIGINTAISSPNGGSVGIGFAIPIDMAKQVMHELIQDGKVSRGFLALVPENIDPTLAEALHLDGQSGALVAQVTPGGPADQAGIRQGDVIVGFAGQPVENSADLRNRVAKTPPGEREKVEILRGGRHEVVSVKLGERPIPEGDEGSSSSSLGQHRKLGLEVENLGPGLRRQLGIDDSVQGVLVVGVDPGSAADRAGLQQGDLILRLDRTATPDVATLERQLSGVSSGSALALVVERNRVSLYFGLRMP